MKKRSAIGEFEIRECTRQEYEEQTERNAKSLKRFLKDAENAHKPHRVIEPEEIPKLLQKHSAGGIFYAYFGREREYTYHTAKTISDVIDNIPYKNELCEDDLYKNTTKDSCRIDFRCDEWIIFPDESFVDKFCDEVKRLSPSNDNDEDLDDVNDNEALDEK